MNFLSKEIFQDFNNKIKSESSELTLKQLKENSRYAQKMIHFGIWTYQIPENEITISDEVYNIYESDFEKSFHGFELHIHPDDRKNVVGKVKKLKEGKNYNIEYRIITDDKKLKFIHEKTEILYDRNDNIQKIIGVIQDITNQKLLEKDLTSIEEHFYENTPIDGVGTWKYDLLEEKYYLNKEAYP